MLIGILLLVGGIALLVGDFLIPGFLLGASLGGILCARIVMMNAAISYALVEPYLYLTLLSHYYSMCARIGLSPNY
jgi:hypothetical protein